MKTVIVTGGIGSGKSAVCAILAARGVPIYDSDSRTKALYDKDPSLPGRLDQALGGGLLTPGGSLDRKALAARIFADDKARETLEGIVYPAVRADFEQWREAQGPAPFVVLESAVILSKPCFDGLADAVVLVDADQELRLRRAMERDGQSREAVLRRMEAQPAVPPEAVDAVLRNEGSPEVLREAVEHLFFHKNGYICKLLKHPTKDMKTDLAKILAIRGQHGLFNYIAQSRNGAIVESLEDGKRNNFSANSGITTLADISIYTDEGELKLQDVFLKLKETLGDQPAPGAKTSPEELKALFAQAVPDYDANRFYVSHMKKVVEWYRTLAQYASLDFLTDEEREAQEAAE